MGHEAKNPVKATRRSFEVLETLYEMDNARLTDISDALDLPDSTVHNHLSTLVESGFVTRDGDVYRISLRFLTFGEFARSRYKISDASRRELTDLVSETSESASVVVAEDRLGYVLVHEPGDTDLPIDLYPGKRIPLHATSFGKMILADLPDETIEGIVEQRGLAACTSETITDREALFDELASIRSQGYAVCDEERLRGVRSLSMAVRSESGIAVGAIGITGPTSRLTQDRLRGSLLDTLTHTKNVIELKLTYS